MTDTRKSMNGWFCTSWANPSDVPNKSTVWDLFPIVQTIPSNSTTESKYGQSSTQMNPTRLWNLGTLLSKIISSPSWIKAKAAQNKGISNLALRIMIKRKKLKTLRRTKKQLIEGFLPIYLYLYLYRYLSMVS